MNKTRISRLLLWAGIGIGFLNLLLESLDIYYLNNYPIVAAVILLFGASIFFDLYKSSKYKQLRFGFTFLYFIILSFFLGGVHKFFKSFLGIEEMVSFILLAIITIPSVIVVLYLIMKSSKFTARKASIEIDQTK